ncbi:MAG: Hpt domain-containing protein, partial [Desulfuromonadales bacterium]
TLARGESFFLFYWRTLCLNLLRALADGSPADVQQYAHKIKGMCSNIGARQYEALARQIEDASKNGTLGDQNDWQERLANDFPRLLDAIAAIDWLELQGN